MSSDRKRKRKRVISESDEDDREDMVLGDMRVDQEKKKKKSKPTQDETKMVSYAKKNSEGKSKKRKKDVIEDDDSDDDYKPETETKKKSHSKKIKSGKKKKVVVSDDEDDYKPETPKKKKKSHKKKTKSEKKKIIASDSDSDEDMILGDLSKSMKKEPSSEVKKERKVSKKKKVTPQRDDSDEDMTLGAFAKKETQKKEQKKRSRDVEQKSSVPKKKRKVSEKNSIEVDTEGITVKGENSSGDMWWEKMEVDEGSKSGKIWNKDRRWETLKHNGVLFPPPYEKHNVRMRYDGEPVSLTLEQEEVATMYASMLETDFITKETFRKNFWEVFRSVLGKNHVIKSLDKCDFGPIFNYLRVEKEKKRLMSKAEKEALKKEKLALEEPCMFAYVDGRKEKVGNFRVEPPGLFRGRGDHPRMGVLKDRVMPEDVTINIGEDEEVPECLEGHNWKDVIHNHGVTWLASWTDSLKQVKYVMLDASSTFRTQSDFEKFEVARQLKNRVDGIRNTYLTQLRSRDSTTRQTALALYFIDKLALRVGNEKDESQADTVGCCSLRKEHFTLLGNNRIVLDFVGKDSIRYTNEIDIIGHAYEALESCLRGKMDDDDVFDKLQPSKLNDYLKSLMPGLSAKVFRTYNASILLDELLNDPKRTLSKVKVDAKGAVKDKQALIAQLESHNSANREVAILCNHQRSVPKTHEKIMGKLDDNVAEAKEFLEALEATYSLFKKKNVEKAKKKWEKFESTREKRWKKALREEKTEFSDQMKEKARVQRELGIKVALTEVEKRKKEKLDKKTFKAKRMPRSDEMFQSQIGRAKERICKLEADARIRDDNKTIALTTSRTNYIDPRISIAWAKRTGVPREKVFPPSLAKKFGWAMVVEKDWKF